MIGSPGECSRMALESLIASGTCGPPITVMPTASKHSWSSARSTSGTVSRSMLPSRMRLWPCWSSAAARFSNGSGKRALWREAMVGLISNVRGGRVMARSPWEVRAPAQPEHQRHRHLERDWIEVRAVGNGGGIEHRLAHCLDGQVERRTGGVPVAVQVLRVAHGVALAVGLEVAQPAERRAD